MYALWWEMVEECSGITRPLDAVSWYATSNGAPVVLDGKVVNGYWSAATNRIVLRGLETLHGEIVRHEMLHALVQHSGHPRSQFLDRCGGTVQCGYGCVDDSDPPPLDRAALAVTAENLEIGLAVSPAHPTMGEYGGFFTVTITARNPANYPVTVSLSRFGPSASVSYYATLGGIGGGPADDTYALDPSVTTFAAGETKRQVFDFTIAGTSSWPALAAGTYTVQGMFGGHWAQSLLVAIGP